MADQPAGDLYSEVWARVHLSPHAGHGGWTMQQGRPVCACGASLAAERAAA